MGTSTGKRALLLTQMPSGSDGLDVDAALNARAAAEQIRAASIHRQLVAALDHWAGIVLLKQGAEGWGGHKPGSGPHRRPRCMGPTA